MGNADLREMIEEINLGTIMDRELSFHKHLAVQVNKANQTLGLNKRSFVSLDEETPPDVQDTGTLIVGVLRHCLAP